MKRCLLTLIAGLLCSVASAQAVFRMQYWFDGEHDNRIIDTFFTSSWQPLLETGHLSSGVHTLFLQVQDSTGKWFPPSSYIFYRIPDADNENQIRYSYWFDYGHEYVHHDSTSTGNLLLDAGMLTKGLHTITFQFDFQNYTSFKHYFFYKSPLSQNDSMEYVFWFDQDYSYRLSGHFMNDHLLIDLDGLSVGLHTLNAQFRGGDYNTFKSYLFYKSPATLSDSVEYVVWFDQNYANLLSGHVLNGHLLLNVDSLSDGIHTLNVQFRSGDYHTFKSSLFYKTPAILGDSVEYVFWFDQDADHRQSGQIHNGHLILDADSLSSGFHTLNAQFGTGNNLTLKSFVFYKKPHSENMIVGYEYWLNDLDSLKQSFTVSPQDTVDVVSMLSVPSLPIRSQCFHFNPNNGVPLINAKNDIHLRFYNAVGRYATKTKSYVDYGVADTVYADTIERNTTKIVAAPTNNAIHWFKLGAGVGDSLSFKVDKPCTMQLYAPDGEMLFHASSDSVLLWNSCHAGLQCDYYLAVHDAADTGTISVSYQWIYRYAVLTWDVHRVGNGGISTITFEGNGFSSLDTMFLVRGTDTVPTLYIERIGNTTMSVVFNFEGVDTGLYSGVFVYTDENLYDSAVVYVEEARPIVLQTTCSYPSAFLRGSTVTFTYTITNTGNMTAYKVPIHVYIGTPSNDGISHIEVTGLDLPPIIDEIDLDSLSADEAAEFEDWEDELGDDHRFFRIRTIDEDSGDSVFVRSNYFLVNLSGYETKTIQFKITSTDSVDVWCVVPDTLAPLTVNIADSSHLSNEYSIMDWYCCYADQISCVLNMISGLLDITPGFGADVASCVFGTLEVFNSALSNGCEGYNSLVYGVHDFFSPFHVAMNSVDILGTLTSCFLARAKAGTRLFKIVKIVDEFLSLTDTYLSSISIVEDCVGAFFTKINHDCPPCHGENCGGGGKSYPRFSMDPNEITGYLAESGSHAVRAEQVEMPFIIEFENDTMFATAPAHTVVVKDTLDSEVFDLESFSATSFGFGEYLEMVNDEQSFTRFVDMRPAMGVIAQVQLNYHIDSTFAVATWTFSSLDTMSLLPITDPELGFLPVNFNGDGVGEVHFTINRKAYLPDSTFIRNRAWITFDNESPIPTSVWTNIVDNTPPEGLLVTFTDSIGEKRMRIVATDNLSGVWRYDLYGQREGVSLLLDACLPADSAFLVDSTFDYDSYYALASDSAGNKGRLELFIPQYTLTAICADSTMGTVAGAGNYTDGNTAVLTAQANCGFHFLQWADNVTENPRQVVIRSDTTLMAIFEADSNVEFFETQCGSYTWQNGMTYSTSGTYYDTLTNVVGCDSVVTLHLTVNSSNTGDTTAVSCDIFDWYGTTYTSSGDYTQTFTNANGCDSVVTLHLTVNYSNTGDTSAVSCDSFDWYGTTFSSSGDYTYTFTNANGCDSVVTLHLTVKSSSTGDTTVVACDGFDWYGTTYTSSGDYMRTFTAANGCDSVVTLHLTVNFSNTGDTTAVSCDNFDWYGTTYTSSGNYLLPFTNVNGCDSVVTLHLTVNYSNAVDTTAVSCDSFDWNGTTFTSSGDYTHTLTNSQGCDSLVTLHLMISESPTPQSISGETELCINQFATYYYDVSDPNYQYRWFKNNELWAENVPAVVLHEMNAGNVLLRMQVTDEQSGCAADSSLLIQVVNRIAPDTTEVRRKANTNILVCQSVNSVYGEVHYRWGYTDLQTYDEVVMPGDHNYCLYDFGIDTLSFRYWVETYLSEPIGEGCDNRSYYAQGVMTSTADYDAGVVEAYMSNNRIVLYVNILSPNNITATLYDANGKHLLMREYGIEETVSDIIPVSFASGVYILKVMVGNQLYSFKLLKI